MRATCANLYVLGISPHNDEEEEEEEEKTKKKDLIQAKKRLRKDNDTVKSGLLKKE